MQRTALMLLALLAVMSCETLKEVESGNPSPERMGVEGSNSSQGRTEEGFTNPAAQEGEFELDSQLCWQSIPASPDKADVDGAWVACMHEQGWTHTP
jgi:hypothetical protein